MALVDYLAQLAAFNSTATKAFAEANDAESLEKARVEFLGAKSGQIRDLQKGLGTVDKADKPAAGKTFNEVKQLAEQAFTAALERVAAVRIKPRGEGSFDPTLPGTLRSLGHVHPLTQTIVELTEIMGRLGFQTADGPEVEDEWHNFEALNIPASHPARDPLENFYLATASRTATTGATPSPLLLRSQTSTVQIRVMEKTPPPVRIIALGRVYRPDTADATHYPMFHQIEGLLVDRDITMAHLKTTLRLFASSYLGSDVHVRFRPSFFPFTEPSVEADMQWKGRWIEFGGAGMVDPHVLTSVGYDPEKVSGFAFGLGIERLCARRHGVDDIREFYRNDVRFLRQF
ncbi:MAG: phenylalanine--tRNA ligase subunit alpha [Pirellulales bacterium]